MTLLSFSALHNIMFAAAKSLQSCPTQCNPIDGSPPGSSVPGILQARILEWVIRRITQVSEVVSYSFSNFMFGSLQFIPEVPR